MKTKKTNTPGKFARTLCDFLWGITHPLKLIRRLRDQQLRIKALRRELRSAYNEVEICKAESEKLKTSVDISLADLSWYQKKQEPALKAANSALGEIIGELTTEQAKKIFCLTVQPEKELLMILVPTEDTKTIMKAMVNKVLAETGEHIIAFSLPVSDVMGLTHFDLMND